MGLPITPLESVLRTTSEYENFSHETRFVSSFDSAVNFSVGFFYADNEFVRGYPPALQPGVDAALAAAGGPPVPGIVPGDLIFITDQPEEVRKLPSSVRSRGTSTTSGHLLSAVAGTAPKWTSWRRPTFCERWASSFSGSQDESGFNPRVMVSADLSNSLNVYASASKGFRIGGVNGQISPTLCGAEIAALNLDPNALRTYDSDDLWSYEAGMKTSFADNRVAVNAAVFTSTGRTRCKTFDWPVASSSPPTSATPRVAARSSKSPPHRWPV